MNKKAIATTEILILILSILAFGILVGEMRVVSAQNPTDDMLNSYERSSSSTGGTNQQDQKTGLIALASNFYKDGILTNFGMAVGINMAIRTVFGSSDQSQAAANSLSAGYFAFSTIKKGFIPKTGAIAKSGTLTKIFTLGGSVPAGPWTAFGWGVGISAAIYLATYKKTKTEYVEYTCKPWDSVTGGNKCEDCNKQGVFPCTEYKCKSLGQACEFIEGNCVWLNKNSVKYPVITLDNSVLPDNYKYSNDNAVSPPNRGVLVLDTSSSDGCVEPYVPFLIGISTDEPAKCRSDTEQKSFEEMSESFGASQLSYNHTIILSFKEVANESSLDIQPGKNFEFYVRCQNALGKENPSAFVFKGCVQEGEDRNSPIIQATSLNPFGFAYMPQGQTETEFSLFTNEIATCRWSTQDKGYENMENTMECETTPEDEEEDFELMYQCDTTLTNLKDNQENKFYFRCQDTKGNKNKDSYEFTIKGTQDLVISSVSPNGTIRDSTEQVKVTLQARTSAGADEGKANCFYSETGRDDTWIPFYYSDGNYDSNSQYTNYQHSQNLDLEEGNYKYHIKCEDVAQNYDTKTVEFNVESDTGTPKVVRVYNEDNSLVIITNEEAECVYDTKNCNYAFVDGLKMTTTNKKKHSVAWNTESSYYIKCKDEYGNEPYPSSCSIVVKPTD